MAKLIILTLTLPEAKALTTYLPHPTDSKVAHPDGGYRDAHRKLNAAIAKAEKPERRKV